jgi:hypothetical protein
MSEQNLSSASVQQPRSTTSFFYALLMKVLLRMKITIASWIFFVLLVDTSPTTQIIPREEPENAARAETGALGRLIYGIISTFCLCAMSFALGIFVQSRSHRSTDP